jgi:hypothetical protein
MLSDTKKGTAYVGVQHGEEQLRDHTNLPKRSAELS